MNHKGETIADKVVKTLKNIPSGLTTRELSEVLQIEMHTLKPILSRMVKKRLIHTSKQLRRRLTEGGKLQRVYVVITKENQWKV